MSKPNIKTLAGMSYAPIHTLSTLEEQGGAVHWMGGLFGVIAALSNGPHDRVTAQHIKVLSEIGAYLAYDTGATMESLVGDIGGGANE